MRSILKKILIFLLICYVSCKKEIKKINTEKELSISDSEIPLYFTKEKEIKQGNETILGERIINPNRLSFLREMIGEMGISIPEEKLKPTHLYIKFLPENHDDIKILYENVQNDNDFILERVPFHYRIVEEGTKFSNPEAKSNSIPPLYSTIKLGYKIPNVKYEILDSMLVPDFTNNLDETEEFALGMAELIGMAINGDIEFNEERLDEIAKELGIEFDEGAGKDSRIWNAIRKTVNKASSIAGTVIANGLHYVQKATVIFLPKDHISGRITVYNHSERTMVPLNGMGIRARRIFVYYNMYSNENGIFKTSEKCSKNYDFDLFMQNNDNLNNRIEAGIEDKTTVFELDFISRITNTFIGTNRIGTLRAERYNRLEIEYGGGYKNKNLWAKATVCNAIKEYNKVARESNIIQYSGSKIWLTDNSSMAGMFQTIGVNYLLDYRTIITQVLFRYINFVTGAFYFLPDITVGVDGDTTNTIYKRVFHELTHYSHALGNPNTTNFWGKVVYGEADNIIFRNGDPYGNGLTPSKETAGAIGLAESWASFMEQYIMYMYENKNDGNRYFHYMNSGNPDNIEDMYYLRQIPSKYSDKNDGWFPTALYHDMIDDGIDTVKLYNDDDNLTNQSVIDFTLDKVKGYTVKDMYNWVRTSHTIENFMDKALQNIPTETLEFDICQQCHGSRLFKEKDKRHHPSPINNREDVENLFRIYRSKR